MTIIHGKGYGKPTLDLNFAGNKSLIDTITRTNYITFTRAQSGNEATYVGSDGLIKYASADEPRFDHDPETLESLGLLVEESRTNIHWFSNTFSNSGAGGSNPKWQDFINVTLQEQTYPDPAGGNTATRIIPTTALGSHYIGRYSIYGTGTYTYSIFVKPQGYSKFGINMNGAGPNVDLSVNPPVFTGGTSTQYGNKIEKLSSGWYRVSFTWVNNGGGGANTFQPRITILDNTGSSNFSGDGVSGIDVYGFQSEIGSFPTSYIPTSGSAVTRAADAASITGTNFSSWFNQTEGTYFANYRRGTSSSTSGRTGIITNASDEYANSYIVDEPGARGFSSRGIGWEKFDNPSVSIGSPVKQTGTYDTINSEATLVVNGRNPVIGIHNYNTSSQTGIRIGGLNNANYRSLNSTISRITYWSKRLPDGALQFITQ